MPEITLEPAEQTPPTTGSTYRDLQRVALRDLVTLATECANTEADIERRYQAALENAKRDAHRANLDIDTRVKALRDSFVQESQQRIAQIEAKCQAEVQAINVADRTARQRVLREHEKVEHEAKKAFEQAVWLAESVCDGTHAQIREDAKAAKKTYTEQVQAAIELEGRMGDLLRLYGQPLPPADEQVPLAGPIEPTQAAEAHKAQMESGEKHLGTLQKLQVPRLFVGARPVLYVLFFIALAGVLTQAFTGGFEPNIKALAISVGSTIVALIVLGSVLRVVGRSHIRQVVAPLRTAVATAREAAAIQLDHTRKIQEARFAEAMDKRKAEEQTAREKISPVLAAAAKRRDGALQAAKDDYGKRLPVMQAEHERVRREADEQHRAAMADLQHRYERELQAVRDRHEKQIAECRRQYEAAREALAQRLNEGLAQTQAPIERNITQGIHAWDDPIWDKWQPPRAFASMIKFGQLEVDLNTIADAVPTKYQRQLVLPPPFTVPMALAFPKQASLLIQADRDSRDEALRTLQMLMVRLLTCLPAGRVRFTLIDPVGLGQNFAGFMHLADHDEALVGTRIWTDPEQIEQRLTDLTEHMETVIQKYLRNEYETIDDYNAQAGELAEPYRFLVISDFPVGFEGESLRRLASIASTGSRCGVYTLIMRDTRHQLPSGTHLDELERHGVNLVRKGDRFAWKDDVFEQFPLTLDGPPSEEFLTRIMDIVGRRAKEAKRVEVPFETITPSAEQFWSASSSTELRVPVGRTGATRLQSVRLGRGVAQHALIAGKTGSGKSTLLHALVTNLAMWYPPEEVEFYLVDFKKGVEFKTYATHVLPHARAIAVESDREFGLSVLQRCDAELARRGALYRKFGVQDLASFRAADPSTVMPRTLLIIDEFQEFFSEDDKLAQDSALLLDRLVRQGRAFGIHVLLGSQTIGGSSGLSRSTLGQMAVRVALQCSEADSQLILGDNNSAARLLSRPGEAIYNDAGGLVEANSPFQVAWLPDEKREGFLIQVLNRAKGRSLPFEQPIVFEGNAPAEITKNQALTSAIELPTWPAPTQAPSAYLGEPVAIKEPTAVPFRRQSGANVLIIGQQEESAMALMAASLISIAAQQSPKMAKFYILDGSPADSPLAEVFRAVTAALPHECKIVEWRQVPEAMAEVAEEIKNRQAEDQPNAPSIFVLIYGVQRYRILRRQEESFSFGSSSDDEPKGPAADKLFADILRDGPAMGAHSIIWADTPVSVERTFDRGSLREFDNRVLFQMSAADSSNLIDSPAGNKLGFNRALAYSEEQGTLEKFRPYALVDRAWLAQIAAKFAAKRL